MLRDLKGILKFISESPSQLDDESNGVRSKWVQLIQDALAGNKLPLLNECQRISEDHILGRGPHPLDVFNAIIVFPEILRYGGLDIKNVRECANPKCKRFFIKTHKRIYCSKRCSNVVNNTAYSPEKHRDRLRLYTKVNWLGKVKELSPKEIMAELMKNKEYQKIIKKLKNQGVDIKEWRYLKEE